VLGLRMTPPRGDNWAGCLGMTVGIVVYCLRTGLPEVARATLVSGFIGGIGFAGASMLKLVEVTSGYETNWHSILEQTTGLFNGIGIAAVMWGLADRSERIKAPEPQTQRWAEPLAVGFVLLVIVYLNLRKNVEQWVKAKAVPEIMYGIPAWVWFEIAVLLVTLTMTILIVRHMKRPLEVVPESWLGKGQAFFLLFLGLMVIGNFERALVGFAEQRLVTEGVIFVNALVCALGLLTAYPPPRLVGITAQPPNNLAPSRLRGVIVLGLAASLMTIVTNWAIVRTIYGDRFAGHASLHIRFGPNATVNPPDRVSPRNPG
jgi:hypothetical protein